MKPGYARGDDHGVSGTAVARAQTRRGEGAAASDGARALLLESAQRYAEQMADSPVLDYLAGCRGITDPVLIGRLGLGFVGKPSPGHERFRGMLSIPYLRYDAMGSTVATIRFACATDGCAHEHHDQTTSLPGHEPRLYNTRDLYARVDELCICLGEWDTITALARGLHAVGVQDAEGWRPYMARAFRGYKKVMLFTRAEDRGRSMRWANEVAAQIPTAVIAPFPNGSEPGTIHTG
ncbi:hypothetical protein [Glycomyces sp. MUSA5-2]|uniref:hypothetical protein n=1 Tax=Glycomyces sp. MUSA5-2 TaxID=2053002 RepID=UPI00300BF588